MRPLMVLVALVVDPVRCMPEKMRPANSTAMLYVERDCSAFLCLVYQERGTCVYVDSKAESYARLILRVFMCVFY